MEIEVGLGGFLHCARCFSLVDTFVWEARLRIVPRCRLFIEHILRLFRQIIHREVKEELLAFFLSLLPAVVIDLIDVGANDTDLATGALLHATLFHVQHRCDTFLALASEIRFRGLLRWRCIRMGESRCEARLHVQGFLVECLLLLDVVANTIR